MRCRSMFPRLFDHDVWDLFLATFPLPGVDLSFRSSLRSFTYILSVENAQLERSIERERERESGREEGFCPARHI